MEHVAGVFKALSDPYRLRIVMFLAEAAPDQTKTPRMVCSADLQRLLGLSQPTISHHLKLLSQAGLVQAQRQGKLTYYQLNARGFKDVQRFGKVYRKLAKTQQKNRSKVSEV